jgi:phthiocerol/phenolphthiocerol synthesis type-I polyketide synthase C
VGALTDRQRFGVSRGHKLSQVHYLHNEIAVVGWSCKLPGANSVSDLWSLLLEGRCAVSKVPADRFALGRYGHPRRTERGKSYTWAAGVIDDIWGFDPSVFGISPREAEQMDPQQRILLQLTWEALEDAGMRPSSIAGTDVGVFIGASQTDYAHAIYGDQAAADSHFATGNALAILANRISYIFDLHGPSVTLDTACSSSLVALHHAVECLRSGRIDTAIVGGINVIASPVEFVSFSQASMLSPTGLCRSFSADADGYVRAEGGVVIVLRRGVASTTSVRGLVLASDVNSDGRTNGISLPSAKAQEELLERLYARAGINPERLSFVEAHGTGTAVGDPIEARALGASLGRPRTAPLPIGSIKSNIGHVEAASGLAGLLKAFLALDHGILPRSLHIDAPNPNIDFRRLNLALCQEPLLLSKAEQRCAGVNSFGFGGTNAHVVIAAAKKTSEPNRHTAAGANFFAISAASKPALATLAKNYRELLSHLSDSETAATANAIAHRRDWLPHRLVVTSTRQRSVSEALAAFATTTEHPQLDCGDAIGQGLPVAFVYSGNGSQWPGMGLSAYRQNAKFRAQFENIDDYFQQIAGWSLKEVLFSDRLKDRLSLTRIAQPLIFAIQSSITAALKAGGVTPSAVIGHSVGEIAAAEAAGILDLRTAVDVVYFRSLHQEQVRGLGRMSAVLTSSETIEELLGGVDGLQIAAHNSPRSCVVAGSTPALADFKRMTEERGIASLDLELDYPFHTAFMTPVQQALIADLKHITPHNEVVPFISTVTGACSPGSRLGADYWWHNIREPVQFLKGIREVAKLGARFFVEIGPRALLLKHIADGLAGEVDGFVSLSVLDRKDPDQDPVRKVVAKALIAGARLDTGSIFGAESNGSITLPTYPWQQQRYHYAATSEAIGVAESESAFCGGRYTPNTLEWYSHIDTALFPQLADHKVGDQIIFPGTGFLEIAFTVARDWLQTPTALVTDFEFLKPLDLSNGETRELMSRVSAGSSTLEIFSRPRLSQASWLLHARAKILHGSIREDTPSVPEHLAQHHFNSAAIYQIADASGLHYGPAFRLLDSAAVVDDTFIRVELGGVAATSDFVLDPIRLDACSHGLLTVFAQLRASERGVSYLPVHTHEAALFVAGGIPQSAIIEVIEKNERSILANYHYFGVNREHLATLRGVRCQAVQVRRDSVIESNAFVELPQLIDGTIVGDSGPTIAADTIVAAARDYGFIADKTVSPGDAEFLIEGCATAAAYQIASGLASNGAVDIEALIGAGRLTTELRPWLARILSNLSTAGLARERHGQWTVVTDPLMPSAASVVQELSAKHPDRAAEIFVGGALAGIAEQIAGGDGIDDVIKSTLTANVLDFYDAAAVSVRQAGRIIEQLLTNDALWPQTRALRVAQLGYGPLSRTLLSLRSKRDIALTVIEPDHRRLDTAQRALARHSEIVLAGPEQLADLGTFDLVLAAESLHRIPDTIGLAGVGQWLAPRGILLAIEPLPSIFSDLAFGFDCELPQLKSTNEWLSALARTGFANAQAHVLTRHCGHATLILAEANPTAQMIAPRVDNIFILETKRRPSAGLGESVDRAMRERGISSTLSPTSDFSEPAPTTVIYVVGGKETPRDAVHELTACCLDMKACADRFGTARATLWLVFRSALAGGNATVDPIATGAWAFSRTLANEFPHLDVRRIDVTATTTDKLAAAQVCDILLSATDETELQIDGTTLRAVRADTLKQVLDRTSAPCANAASLKRSSIPGQRFRWEPTERAAPGPNEVEIAVVATGLNFRDVMWALSLLPDEMIEQGGASPALGCECAGEVTRVGTAVRHLRPGDHVAAFANGAFATHVMLEVDQVVKLPPGMSCQAGATIPVAFLTAHFSLVVHAQLKRNEWVLIHGGAGGVGMAAIQIALARKARIIATAGSEAKRNLLKTLGVHHVLDSRSTMFVDEVRRITGEGVDVVLNSLAGEAMERSISCLREFGRFVELGKRDYIANTHIGLRPFRKNLTYFGVDLGHLMLGKQGVARKAFAQLMRQFASGALTPLPYSEFPASELAEAFHLMQHSNHVGKIVVRPPSLANVKQSYAPFAVSSAGTHVITGGFGGFGLETAKWLANRGARHLVLIGRRGAVAEEAKAVVADLTARGVQVYAGACDIADRRAVERLFAYIGSAMPAVAGVLHAAMVLDDGLLSNLNHDRFRGVLAPKVEGVQNLEAVTRGMRLDYFVLFSSATTLMGNPGQANYVAANAYMEGVSRRRRQEGRPALAIGWGPITDVGVLARSEMLRSRFQRLTGVRGMRAAEALDLMAQALELPSSPELAVITISPTEGIFTADRLQVLKSPTYAYLVRGDNTIGESGVGHFDLQELAKTQGIEAARVALTGIIVAQLARVLHAREDEISRVRAVGEIGLDSLMALEFAMNLEDSFGIHITLTSSIGDLTVAGLANEIILQLDLSPAQENVMARNIADNHFEKAEPLRLALLEELAENVAVRRKGKLT